MAVLGQPGLYEPDRIGEIGTPMKVTGAEDADLFLRRPEQSRRLEYEAI